MFLKELIKSLTAEISSARKAVLQPLIDFIQEKKDAGLLINLNFICTHNSRRSHMAQIWAQTMADFYGIKQVFCYSGGTETTAVFPKIWETLNFQGFAIQKLSEGSNPVYAVKFNENAHPVICFSKTYDDAFNPKSDFAAVMTCFNAQEGCPFIPGAEMRIAVPYDDPKSFDNTPEMDETYRERSLEIANEMRFVFSQIK